MRHTVYRFDPTLHTCGLTLPREAACGLSALQKAPQCLKDALPVCKNRKCASNAVVPNLGVTPRETGTTVYPFKRSGWSGDGSNSLTGIILLLPQRALLKYQGVTRPSGGGGVAIFNAGCPAAPNNHHTHFWVCSSPDLGQIIGGREGAPEGIGAPCPLQIAVLPAGTLTELSLSVVVQCL